MARERSYQALQVYMNGMHVGVLEREALGHLVFTYDKKWLDFDAARPISLSMPLKEGAYKGVLVESYFNNLLPDSDVIRKRIQARFHATTDNCFELLSYIGKDCVGAIQLLTDKPKVGKNKIDARPVSDHEIENLLKHYQTAPLGMGRDMDFRISLAGAQEKSALLWHQGKWCLPFGTTATSHIVKLPIGKIAHADIDLSDSVENEWLCLEILAHFGLLVNKASITYFNALKTLVIERFDRVWNPEKTWLLRLPQEDLCQALGVSSGLKYESDGGPGIQEIMLVLLGSECALQDRITFMKTVFLFWLLGAIDGHAKNFSLFLKVQGRYQLTPLYDVISAYPLVVSRHKMKLAMAVRGKNKHYSISQIQKRHWLSTASYCQFSTQLMEQIIEEVLESLESVIDKVTQKLPKSFPDKIAESIFQGMRLSKDRMVE